MGICSVHNDFVVGWRVHSWKLNGAQEKNGKWLIYTIDMLGTCQDYTTIWFVSYTSFISAKEIIKLQSWLRTRMHRSLPGALTWIVFRQPHMMISRSVCTMLWAFSSIPLHRPPCGPCLANSHWECPGVLCLTGGARPCHWLRGHADQWHNEPCTGGSFAGTCWSLRGW